MKKSSHQNSDIPETTEEESIHLSFDEWVVHTWSQHKNAILLSIAAVAVAIVGFQMFEKARQSRVADMQVAYQQISNDTGKLIAFAQKHSGQPLAGVAFLKLGDEEYSNENFSQAAQYYKLAASMLPDEMKSRAQFGQAMSTLRTNNTAQAMPLLETLSNDTENLMTLRAEAAYTLAILDLQAGHHDDFERQLTKLEQLPNSEFWVQSARNMQNAASLESKDS